MSDDKERDDDANRSSSPREPDKNPFISKQIIVWALILLVLPLVVFFTFRDDDKPVDTLDASAFERALMEGRVWSVLVQEQSATSIQKVSGEYWPETVPLVERQNGKAKLRKYRSKVIYSDAMDAMIRDHSPVRDVKQDGSFWGSILTSMLPLLLFVLVMYFIFMHQFRAANGSAFQFGKSKARMMLPSSENKITLKDVAGVREAKEEMQEIVEYLRDPAKFQRLGGRVPRGILMVGPPGTGKTLMAKAIAGEAKVPFFSISGSDFVEMFVGVGASRVRDMFAEAKKHAPCLIFIDEIDAVGRSRFSGIGGGHDEREQTLNALLVEMDGFEEKNSVIVIAATNRPDVLDKALMRPGRFDRQVVIDLPDQQGRYEILKVHAAKIKLDSSVDLRTIARGTPGFSGADLANLLNEAAILATRADRTAVIEADLEEARDKVCWGKERRSRRMTERQRRLTAYHEAGHTMVNLYCEHTEPLHKVTIIPRGMALGATMFLSETDRYDMTENEAIDMMTMCMGGRCAEKLIFNELTSGGSMDIRQATNMGHKMVCEWGMSTRLGPLNYAGREDHIFLGRDITRSDGVSQDTAREIDEEVRKLVKGAEDRATGILTEHKEQFVTLAEELLKRETMTASEVYQLLGMPERVLSNEGFSEAGELGAANGADGAEKACDVASGDGKQGETAPSAAGEASDSVASDESKQA